MLDGKTQYSDSVNPTIFNEFEAAALRFGHSTIPGKQIYQYGIKFITENNFL
jgi:hypothetical protein